MLCRGLRCPVKNGIALIPMGQTDEERVCGWVGGREDAVLSHLAVLSGLQHPASPTHPPSPLSLHFILLLSSFSSFSTYSTTDFVSPVIAGP